jgi:hypothetical protein
MWTVCMTKTKFLEIKTRKPFIPRNNRFQKIPRANKYKKKRNMMKSWVSTGKMQLSKIFAQIQPKDQKSSGILNWQLRPQLKMYKLMHTLSEVEVENKDKWSSKPKVFFKRKSRNFRHLKFNKVKPLALKIFPFGLNFSRKTKMKQMKIMKLQVWNKSNRPKSDKI